MEKIYLFFIVTYNNLHIIFRIIKIKEIYKLFIFF